MNDETKKKKHVAWRDQVGLSKRWEEAIKNCFLSYGTNDFKIHVNAFKLLMVDIKDGASLKSDCVNKENELTNEGKQMIMDHLNNNPKIAEDDAKYRDAQSQVDEILTEKLFSFMLQLLCDNNFIFYKSEFDGEYDQWD